jgi:hypothetical protein
MKTTINGKTYKVMKHRDGDRYVKVHVDDLVSGMRLDMGVYTHRTDSLFHGTINPLAWDMHLASGFRYTESRGATVRVWISVAS